MRSVAIGLMVLLGAVGVACGGASSEVPEGLATNRALELFSWWTAPGEEEALQSLISLHQEAHPENRMFNAAIVDGENTQKLLRQRLLNGDPPDFFQGNIHDVRKMVRQIPQVAQPLDSLFEELGLREVLYPELLTNLEVNGQIIAMPVNIHRENAVFYNQAIFERLNLELPQTVAEFWEVCAALKAAGVVPIATSYQGWIVRIFFSAVAMGQMGSEAYLRFIKGAVPVAESGVQNAISAFARILNDYINEDAGQRGFGWVQAASAVLHGDAAMIFHGDWVKGYFQSLGARPGVDFLVSGAPGADELFLYGMDVFVLPQNAQNERSAKELLATVSTRRTQVIFNGYKGSSPMRNDVPLVGLDPVAAATFRALKTAQHRLLTGSPPEWTEAFSEFARTRNEDALYQTFLRYPPSKR